jgi:putative membrane protein
MNGYYGIRRLLTTPVPFPLIQMARTFLFLYVFTVPFVMLGDESSFVAHYFTVFVLTYGFIGLELVAIELDSPFGEDANDFNNK